MAQKDTRASVFTAALFTIARTWKQTKRPFAEEWIKKMCYIYTREYYSAIKRDEIGSLVEIWVDLESATPSPQGNHTLRGRGGADITLIITKQLKINVHSDVNVAHAAELFSTAAAILQLSSVAQSCPTLCSSTVCSRQASLSFPSSRSLLKFMSIKLVVPANHFILCRPLLILPSIFPSIRVFF